MKLRDKAVRMEAHMSPPMRGRGLKRNCTQGAGTETNVAPHAGAWIETSLK